MKMNLDDQKVTIRLEREEDYRFVENLTREAFWNVYHPGCMEHFVLHRFRKDPDFVPELDFVLERNGVIIGHVMFARSEIKADDGRSIPILTFGPISIAPEFKRQGYGKMLLDHAISKAWELGYGAIAMTGNIAFYGKCGFVVASTLGIRYAEAEPDDSVVPYFLAQELTPGFLNGVTGTFKEPAGYFVCLTYPDEFAAYEATFPAKEKLVRPGQLPR